GSPAGTLRAGSLRTRRSRRRLRLLVPVPAGLPRGAAISRAAPVRGRARRARGPARAGRPGGTAVPPPPALVSRAVARSRCRNRLGRHRRACNSVLAPARLAGGPPL